MLEDGPVRDWLVVTVGGVETRKGGGGVGWRASGDPRLLTPDFGMTFFFFFGVKFPIFVGLMDQRTDASLGLKAELCSFSKSLFFNRYILQVV